MGIWVVPSSRPFLMGCQESSCSCQTSFLSLVQGSPLSRKMPTPVIHNLLFDFLWHLFPLTLMRGIRGFFKIQMALVWGHGDVGRIPVELWEELGATALTSGCNLEMLLLHQLSISLQISPLLWASHGQAKFHYINVQKRCITLMCRKDGQVSGLKLLWHFLCFFDLFSSPCQTLIFSKSQPSKRENIHFFLPF